jgi:uncharacterized membrane protein YgdD (TMEM256/DUF423 family)
MSPATRGRASCCAAARSTAWVHAAALIAVATMGERRERVGLALGVAGWGFAAGIVLFSFSLFALALTEIGGFARVTPFGGVALMIGWAALAISAGRRR